MEGMPARFYRYRYENYWEVELPVGWTVEQNTCHLVIINSSGRVFSISTFTGEYKGKEEDREKLPAEYRKLTEENAERKPSMDYEWNGSFETRYRTRMWRFSGKDFRIQVIQDTKAEKTDARIDSIVNRFITSLCSVEK